MGDMHLHKDDDNSFPIEVDTWGKLLGLARTYGWQPQGDIRYECYRPDGMFDTAWDFERTAPFVVTEADALALADALEKALPDLDKVRQRISSHPFAEFAHRSQIPDTPPLDWFSSPHNRTGLENVIRFCRDGGDFLA